MAPPLLQIPLAIENSDDFFDRMAALILEGRSHIYVDTSLLMWMTKIGNDARSQLIEWLEENCRGRLHVPMWAAHEYLRHHVEGTVKSNLADSADILRKAAGVYRSIHPYLDVKLGTEAASKQQSDARQILKRTGDLAEDLKAWSQFYESHAHAVLQFINRHSLEGTNAFDLMDSIEVTGTARYSGRLPPGFRDQNKKESRSKAHPSGDAERGTHNDGDDDQGGIVGHNRWGDLIFWKEILEHARRRRARAILILSNDRKNDWYMGGGTSAGISVEMQRVERLKPIPRPHPVLAAEARSVSGASQLALLDSPYLALLIKRIAPAASDALADVALVQKLAAGRASRSDGGDADADGSAAGRGPPVIATWKDPATVIYSKAKLRDALVESRSAPAGKAAAMIASSEAALAAGEGIAQLLSEQHLGTADTTALVLFAREAGDRARKGEANWPSAASDIIGALNTIPHKTAGCLYFGLLASAYLERSNNSVRLPPEAPFLNLLWETSGMQHLNPAIAGVRERIDRDGKRPLHVIGDRGSISVTLDVDSGGEHPTDLREIRIGDRRLLQPVQFKSELRLRELAAGSETITGEHAARLACQIFGIPFGAITPSEDFARDFTIRRELGFRDPATVFDAKQEEE